MILLELRMMSLDGVKNLNIHLYHLLHIYIEFIDNILDSESSSKEFSCLLRCGIELLSNEWSEKFILNVSSTNPYFLYYCRNLYICVCAIILGVLIVLAFLYRLLQNDHLYICHSTCGFIMTLLIPILDHCLGIVLVGLDLYHRHFERRISAGHSKNLSFLKKVFSANQESLKFQWRFLFLNCSRVLSEIQNMCYRTF